MLSLFTPVCVLFTVVNGAKILAVWPTPSISHQVVFRPLTEELARRGHEVTVITTDPAFEKGKAPPNLREIDLHDLSYNIRSSRVFDLSTGNREDVAAQLRIFGTNVSPSTLPAQKIQTMVNVFSQLPYDIIWKWDKDELPGRTDNIRISKWLPQSDLLKKYVHLNIGVKIDMDTLNEKDLKAGIYKILDNADRSKRPY
ncbi:UDP-glycosyltransferase UGT33F2 [Operophtera brumata]|uniref:UDP-glycosyltransferase UGT33F2 n=1 Tax=Operophtera brumata TaxID=104452 RepID=A0A0L7KLI1_OPEBR|nr:UDP-glycosyltransferase UGT33F2 [Operophtera brumata]